MTVEPDYDRVRRRVLAERLLRGASQAEIAAELDFPESRVNRVDSGVSVYGLREMALHLGVPVPDDLPASGVRRTRPRRRDSAEAYARTVAPLPTQPGATARDD